MQVPFFVWEGAQVSRRIPVDRGVKEGEDILKDERQVVSSKGPLPTMQKRKRCNEKLHIVTSTSVKEKGPKGKCLRTAHRRNTSEKGGRRKESPGRENRGRKPGERRKE